MRSNSEIVSRQNKLIGNSRQTLSKLLDEYTSAMTAGFTQLKHETEAAHAKELENWASGGVQIEARLKEMQQSLEFIHSQDSLENDYLQSLRITTSDTRNMFLTRFSEWSAVLHETCEKTSRTMEAAGATTILVVEQVVRNLASLVETIVQEVLDQVESQKETVRQVDTLAQEASASELARLKKQSFTLAKLVESEKVKVLKAKDELLSKVSSLLGDFATERDRGLREALTTVQSDISAGEIEVTSFKRKHAEMMEDMDASASQLHDGLQARRLESKRLRDSAMKVTGYPFLTITILSRLAIEIGTFSI
jgi:kinesin family member 11